MPYPVYAGGYAADQFRTNADISGMPGDGYRTGMELINSEVVAGLYVMPHVQSYTTSIDSKVACIIYQNKTVHAVP
jgi:hypothetical protein